MNRYVAALVSLSVVALLGAEERPTVPPTPKKPVLDRYHGVEVVDPYRWLENARDPEVRRWTAAQNRHAHASLDSLPGRDAIRKRLGHLYSATSADYFRLQERGRKLFALERQPPKNQPLLVTLASANEPSSERVVVDPNKINPRGTTAIDFFVPSLDGRRVAVSLSEGGNEEGTLHVYDAATGKELGDVISRVNGGTAGGSVAWNADGSGFYYTRYPRGNERPREDLDFYQQVYFHKLGTATEEDRYVLGKDFPRIAETQLRTSPDGRYILAMVANGDGGEVAHYLLTPSGRWVQLSRFEDRITEVVFGRDQALYLLSVKGSPRGKVLRMPLDQPDLGKAAVVVKASQVTISRVLPTANRLFVVDQIGGPSQIRVFDLEGNALTPVPVLPVSSVDQVVRLHDDSILFRTESFLRPPAWYHYDPTTARMARTKLFTTSPAEFSDCEVVRVFATSKDGTKVPLNILRKKGTMLDGNNPTLLYGYGGYGASLLPHFNVAYRAWLEQGGVMAIANLRGGGEYGEEWHEAGKLTRKQNVFDDFIACAQYLIDTKYTRPERLAIEGGSNGGLLMGAVLTQRPDLFRAVVSHVGIYDMLRTELHPNGAFNITEFGTVRDREQFKALLSYSPYHRVRDGVAYPAVLLLTGENDTRVDPACSRKMAARLQAATTSRQPVLLRTTAEAGHGIDSSLSERIAEGTDVVAFLFAMLGVKYQEVR